MSAKPAKRLSLFAAVLILVAGCGHGAVKDHPRVSHGVVERAAYSKDAAVARDKLYSQYEEWKGVRYRYGGLSKRGIDCSGFVHVTFRSKFGVRLPRTTEKLSRVGAPVERSGLRTGDLVFFRTGRKVRHVGIYIENGKFLHASKNRGVMISRLNNVYWNERYWKAARVDIL